MNIDRITQVSATTAARRIRQGEISSQDTVRRYLERIEQVNPLLNTVIQLAPESAIEQARAADDAVRRGEPVGALHGVPFTVMDVFPVVDSARLVAASNMRDALYFGESREATVVSRLRMAGAIPIGVTKATEWSDRDGHYGRSHNPYDVDRTPGGSSGGEAATVAAGASAFGIGSDTGGTLRIPAHYCGVAALRPSNGRVPRGIDIDTPNDFQTVAGPVARSVEDLITVMEIISGVDHGDSRSVPLAWRDPKSVNLRGLRVALFTSNGIAPPTPAVARAVIAAAASLERAGAYVDNVIPPSLDTALQLAKRYRHYCTAEGNVAEYYKFLERLDSYRLVMTEFMSDFDLIVCPVEAFAAPLAGAQKESEPFTYTAPFSLLAWPCATVRAGTSAEGLPIGVQVVGSPWRDDLALAAALHIENVLGGWRQPSLSRNVAGEMLAVA